MESTGAQASLYPADSGARLAAGGLSFEAVYDAQADFVWRSLRRLGVAEAQADDALQDVFLVVHRRLDEFEGRSSLRTWLFGIALRVARDYRRTSERKGGAGAEGPVDPDTIADAEGARPDERAAQAERLRTLYALLDELDEDKRAVFILSELEQMSAPDIAEALSININTLYSRIRVARQSFEQALARHRARAARRVR